MAHATIKLMDVDPKSKVVRFNYYSPNDRDEDVEEQIIMNIYVNKALAKKLLGTKDLAKEKGIEVTLRLVK